MEPPSISNVIDKYSVNLFFSKDFLNVTSTWEVKYLYPPTKNDLISLFLYDQLGERIVYEFKNDAEETGVL